MKRARVIPVLLIKNRGLYKTIKFKNERYVGDPLNVVRIFNEKQCDEIIFLDISATINKKDIDYHLIEKLATECFMPVSYGGGITTITQIEKIIKLGIEKVVLNTSILIKPSFLEEASNIFGSSTIVASVDVKLKNLNKYSIHSYSGFDTKGLELFQFLKLLENCGAGEIMINSVDRDGMMNGYDLELAKKVSNNLSIPVIFCGGCRNIDDIKALLKQTNVSAAAAGSFFVFHGPHKGVLINYPEPEVFEKIYE